MIKHLTAVTLFLVLATQADARQPGGIWGNLPDLSGTWFNGGNSNQPCEIIQRRPDGRAQFVNEKGSMAWAQINRDHVFIPDWNEGRGQRGVLRGDRIVWPNGSYWSRVPERGPPPRPYYDSDGSGYGGGGYGPPQRGGGYAPPGYNPPGYGGQWGRGSRPW